jgi:hypothetical protein
MYIYIYMYVCIYMIHYIPFLCFHLEFCLSIFHLRLDGFSASMRIQKDCPVPFILCTFAHRALVCIAHGGGSNLQANMTHAQQKPELGSTAPPSPSQAKVPVQSESESACSNRKCLSTEQSSLISAITMSTQRWQRSRYQFRAVICNCNGL